MTEITQELNLNQIAILLSRYGFDLRGYTPEELVEQWQPLYPLLWMRLAVVEALYQGRYKVISVEQILNLWLRRGQPTFHFNLEFERLICYNLLRRTIAEREPLISLPTEVATEVIAETLPSLPVDETRDQSSSLEDPRQAMSNLEELFSQFVPLDPPEEDNKKETAFSNGFLGTSPKVSIDQFTPLLDHSGLYSKLKAVIQKS